MLFALQNCCVCKGISSCSGVGERGHSHHVLRYQSTNRFFLELSKTSINLGTLQLQFISITENANNPPPQATMTPQSPQPDRDIDTDTQRQLQSHAMETTL